VSSQKPFDSVDAVGIDRSAAAAIAGPIAALTVAGALVSRRETLGVANVGFVILLVVLLASVIGGRIAGVLTAVVGALAFNFFHTQPYLSFAVAAREDVISVILCGAAGIGIGEVGARLHQYADDLRHTCAARDLAQQLLDDVAHGADAAQVWRDAERTISEAIGTEPSFRSPTGQPARPPVTAVPVDWRGHRVGAIEVRTAHPAAASYLAPLASALAATIHDVDDLDRIGRRA
jgi:K+-sensing histidine kinase KdpD